MHVCIIEKGIVTSFFLKNVTQEILTTVMYKSDKRTLVLFYVHVQCVHHLARYILKTRILIVELNRFQGRLHLTSTLSTATKEVFTWPGRVT